MRLIATLALLLAAPAAAQTAPTYSTATGNTLNAQGTFPISPPSLATGQAAVTTTSTLVAAARPGRVRIIISPTSSVVYYIGNNGVTAANGSYVPAGASVTLDTSAAIYAVGASAVTISYIETF